MRLLLDENLSPALSRFLIAAGHDVVHVRDRGLTSATDAVVPALAAAEARVLVSADTDFGTLLARSGATEPSVVLIRRAVGRRATEQADLLIDNLPVAKADLEDGAESTPNVTATGTPEKHGGGPIVSPGPVYSHRKLTTIRPPF